MSKTIVHQVNLPDIQALKEQVCKALLKAPEGSLKTELHKGKYPQYYYVSEQERKNHPHGRYLRKSEMELATQLAQKEYNQLILKELLKIEKEIDKGGNCEDMDGLLQVFERLPIAKKQLITPYIAPCDEFIKMWTDSLQGSENDYPIINGYITEKGETVRSKSEKIIADKLYFKGIPYVYEAKLVLQNNAFVYPDFTMLNVRTRKTFYLEHFGMMDNPEYCNKAIEKIELYEASGLYAGEQFLFTMESSLKGLNINQLNSLIERKLV